MFNNNFDIFNIFGENTFTVIYGVKNLMKDCWLNNKSVVVVGAGSGLGKHMAFNLIVKHNCKVIGVDINGKSLQSFCSVPS